MREKTVSKKENLFAASRFVLPEHRELYLRIKEEQARYTPPQLDEEQHAELSERIWSAFQQKKGISVTYYDGKAARRCAGRVMHVDQAAARLKLAAGEQMLWLAFSQLIDVQE